MDYNGLDGPLVVDVYVGVSQAHAHALAFAGQPVPAPQLITAQVDTGACATCIDSAVLKALGLSGNGSVTMLGAVLSKPTPAEQYDVALAIPDSGANPNCQHVPALTVSAWPELKANVGFDALIGRDVLKHCLLIYNGPARSFSLTFTNRYLVAPTAQKA